MRYFVDSTAPWKILYTEGLPITTDELFGETLARALYGDFAGRFADVGSSLKPDTDSPQILNGNNIFLIRKEKNFIDLWQFGGYASDMYGKIIPHTYRVRKIGYVVENLMPAFS